MRWKNLKSNLCPKCDSPLKDYSCTSEKCKFSIDRVKFDEIVSDLYKKKNAYVPRSMEDNLSDLNNLGHEEMREDFSDSPFL